jgi:hypothetical protein
MSNRNQKQRRSHRFLGNQSLSKPKVWRGKRPRQLCRLVSNGRESHPVCRRSPYSQFAVHVLHGVGCVLVCAAERAFPLFPLSSDSFAPITMGVHGLATYLRENLRILSTPLVLSQDRSNTTLPVVVDGWSCVGLINTLSNIIDDPSIASYTNYITDLACLGYMVASLGSSGTL